MKKIITFHAPRTAYHGMMMAIIITLLAACDNNDPAGGSNTQARAIITATIASPPYEGGVPRRGEGVQTSSSINTKAADAYGYDGLKKTAFVNGDEISIAYEIGAANKTIVATYDAISDKWSTATDFYIEAVLNNNFNASYTKADTEAAGITTYHDNLEAVAKPSPPINEGPYTLDFTFGHSRTLLQTVLSYEDGSAVPAANISAIHIYITDADKNDKKLVANVSAGNRCIAPAGATITKVEVTPATGAVLTAPANVSIPSTQKGETYTLRVTMLSSGAATLSVEQHEIPAWNASQEGKLHNTATLHYIYDEGDLIAFRDAVNAENGGNPSLNALQMDNIVITATNWEPISTNLAYGFSYSGTYNGNGYTIAGLKTTGTKGNAGLFRYTEGATLVNIHLTGVDIKAAAGIFSAGALVGRANTTTIALCSSSGTVEGTEFAGGLVGDLVDSHLTRSRSTCNISTTASSDAYAGGLVGYSSGIIAACMASGNVTSGGDNSSAGGLVGFNESTITHSYATGTATATAPNPATAHSGGLAGNNSGNIYYSYTIQPTLTSSGIGIISSWWSGQAGTAGDAVRTAVGAVNEVPVRTWVNGEVKTVVFNATVWTDGNFPTLKYNNTGTVQP